MSKPHEVIEARYGNVFVYFSENVKIISDESASQSGELVSLWSTYLDVGTVNPVVLIVISDPGKTGGVSKLKDLPWKSVHVRSYNSYKELETSGIDVKTNNPQKPTKNALYEVNDFAMTAVAQTETSKTYFFEEANMGRMTLHCVKSNISVGGNELPSKTSFLPSLQDNNWVYEK